ncbi:cob(I)yrinic acid a,c-diamide adenosyltransferase [Bryobacter aggregatus]|uniref:cob(I)yrinic acid a,c-diamide adenosyltransferase n=1 Tax=Bryobacter aggregatus TaxID=360054 RepID=UPI0004E0C380|nr:cob(I)yrinic acid a,c-diamide adenosyltransferase [Bryobacter aggregatus]
MSIATMRGDGGQTGLSGGVRVSKSAPLVEAFGTMDELISSLGFARAICQDQEIHDATKRIQKELFRVASAVSTPKESPKGRPPIDDALVDALTEHVHRIEAMPGVLNDWSLPGEDPVSAAYDVARTICRRAERLMVGLREAGDDFQPNVLRYLNRLSDLLWLFGRQIEKQEGKDATLRDASKGGPRWSRAW